MKISCTTYFDSTIMSDLSRVSRLFETWRCTYEEGYPELCPSSFLSLRQANGTSDFHFKLRTEFIKQPGCREGEGRSLLELAVDGFNQMTGVILWCIINS